MRREVPNFYREKFVTRSAPNFEKGHRPCKQVCESRLPRGDIMMDDAKYTTLTGVTFVVPVHPRVAPVHAQGAMQVQRKATAERAAIAPTTATVLVVYSAALNQFYSTYYSVYCLSWCCLPEGQSRWSFGSCLLFVWRRRSLRKMLCCMMCSVVRIV